MIPSPVPQTSVCNLHIRISSRLYIYINPRGSGRGLAPARAEKVCKIYFDRPHSTLIKIIPTTICIIYLESESSTFGSLFYVGTFIRGRINPKAMIRLPTKKHPPVEADVWQPTGTPMQTRTALYGSGGRRSVH